MTPLALPLGNIVIDTFIKGGPIMWPILVTSFIAVAVIAERTIWWFRLKLKRSPRKLDEIYTALEDGDVRKASQLAKASPDPIAGVIYHGLNHHHTSLENALQVSAGIEIERAGRFLGVLDTVITLAPLLGLLGTVTGMMHSFNFVGGDGVEATKVSGGIAESLIATASGLVIAILTLLPFNYYTSLVAKYTFQLQTAATNVEVLVNSHKKQSRKEKEEDEAALSVAS